MRRRSAGARVGIWVVQLILPISVLIALPAPVRKSLAPAGAAVLEKINREGRATYWVVLSLVWCAGIFLVFSTIAVSRFSRRR